MKNKLSKEEYKNFYIHLFIQKTAELNRLPCRKDFSEEDVVRIKALFGPWPRAWEAAGLKEPKYSLRLEKNLRRRIRTKIRKREYKLKLRENMKVKTETKE